MNVSFNQITAKPVSTQDQVAPHYDVNFKGQIGDSFIRDIKQEKPVNTESVMDKVSGFLGLDKSKVKDVLDSFIDTIKNLNKQNADLKSKLSLSNHTQQQLQEQLENCKNELSSKNYEIYQANLEKQQAQKEASIAKQEVDRAKEEVVQAKEEAETAKLEAQTAREEAKKAQNFAEKYEPMTKIKSIGEQEIITPEKFVETVKEIQENKQKAIDSMFTFLTTGEGQDEAIKQLERHKIMQKAYSDYYFYGFGKNFMNDVNVIDDSIFRGDIMQIPYNGNKDDFTFLRDLIQDSIKSNQNSYILESKQGRQVVEDNAIALLTPFAPQNVNVKTDIQTIMSNAIS